MSEIAHISYSSDDLINGVNHIARQITLDDWRPDIIVGVLRGGIVPASYLSHWFDCPLISVHHINKTLMVIDHDFIQSNANVLVVDDIADSGFTLRQVVDCLKEKLDDSTVKSAVLHYNLGQDLFEVDYYHKEINSVENPCWITYPWESF